MILIVDRSPVSIGLQEARLYWSDMPAMLNSNTAHIIVDLTCVIEINKLSISFNPCWRINHVASAGE